MKVSAAFVKTTSTVAPLPRRRPTSSQLLKAAMLPVTMSVMRLPFRGDELHEKSKDKTFSKVNLRKFSQDWEGFAHLPNPSLLKDDLVIA